MDKWKYPVNRGVLNSEVTFDLQALISLREGKGHEHFKYSYKGNNRFT